MLFDVGCACGTGLAAVDAGLGAPFLGEAADGPVSCFVEAEQVADDATVQEGAVGVGVGQVGGHEVAFAKVVEDVFGGGKLPVGKRAEVEDGERVGGTYGNACLTGPLAAGMPPVHSANPAYYCPK